MKVLVYGAGAGVMDIGFLHAAVPEQRKRTMEQRRLCMDASIEGYDLLLKLGYSIVPEGDDAYYRPGPKRRVMQFVMYVMSKTMVGELMAAVHCRHAVSEMEALGNAWTELRKQAPDFPMPNWDALRGVMPDWETLHQQYENKEGGALRWNATKKRITN